MAYSGSTNVNYLGMDLDSSPNQVKEGFYTYALNAVLNTQFDYLFSFSNAPSNSLLVELSLPIGFYLIGKIDTYENGVYFIHIVNLAGVSRIAKIDVNRKTYVNYVDETNILLNYSIFHQIEGEYRKNLNCKETIYFTDDYNDIRYIDVSVPYASGFTITPNSIKLFPDYYDTPGVNDYLCISVNDVGENGNLNTGAYQFEIEYADVAGNPITAPIGLTGVISIYSPNSTGGWASVEGSPSNVSTYKSIELVFSNLNTNLNYFNLIVLQTIQGGTTAYKVVTLPINTINYTYTGFESGTEPITLERAYKVDKFYKKAKTVTTVNNYLLWGNLEGGSTPNLQRLVTNNIWLNWKDYGIKYDDLSKDYKNPTSSAYRKSYLRDEVYAIGISFLLQDGQETATFHIPNREKNKKNGGGDIIGGADSYNSTVYSYNVWDDVIISNNDTIDPKTTLVDPKERWRVYNTATINNPVPVVENSLGCKRYGDFSYHEGDVDYPVIQDCVGNVYPTGKIRHHKFPDCNISPLYDITYTETQLDIDNPFNCDGKFTFDDLGLLTDVFLNYKNLSKGTNTKAYPVTINLLGIDFPQESYDAFIAALQAEIPLYYPELVNNPIVGYNVYVSNRDVDKTIIAKGQIYNSRLQDISPDLDGSEYAGFQNFPFNPLVGDPYTTVDCLANPITAELRDLTYKLDFSTSKTISKKLFNFWSPSTTFNVIKLRPTSIKIEQSNFGQGYTEMIFPKDGYDEVLNKQVPLVDDPNYNPCLILIGYGDYTSRTKLDSTYIQNINYNLNGSKYINNTSGTILSDSEISFDFNNNLKPQTVVLEINATINTVADTRLLKDPSTVEGLCTMYYGGTDTPNADLIFGGISVTGGGDPYENIISQTDNAMATVISAQYISLKNGNNSPYSDLQNIKYNKVDPNCFNNECGIIFGGDTFITFFGSKKSHNYFTNYVNGAAINYTEVENFTAPLTSGWIEQRDGNLNLKTDPAGTRYYKTKDGKNKTYFLLASNTVSGFFCESEVNTELRYSTDDTDKKYYPNTFFRDILDLSEIIYPDWYTKYNYWFYNQDYSKQFDNKSYYLLNNLQLTDCAYCNSVFDNRVIYSNRTNAEELNDSWLVYPALHYYDFPLESGEIWSIKSIQEDKLFTRCINAAYIQVANQTLQTNENIVEIKTVELFNPEPTKIISVDGGYFGTTSQWAYDNTPNGSFYVDSLNTQVFSYDGQTPNSISNSKVNMWSKNNLGFKILDDYPDFPNFDNPYNPISGVGFISVWDNYNELWLLTKKDYKLRNKKLDGRPITTKPELILSGSNQGSFIISENQQSKIINFTDKDYFTEQSFTISYSPNTKHWVSFYSFLPNVYLFNKDRFISYISSENGRGKFWSHNSDSSFGIYYDNQYKHQLEFVSKLDILVSTKRSIQWITKSFSYDSDNSEPFENKFDTWYNAIVYNSEECTGLMNLIPPTVAGINTLLDLPNILQYPIINSNSIDVQLSQQTNDNVWKLSDIFNRVGNRNNNTPTGYIFTNSIYNQDYLNALPIDKILNSTAIDYNKPWYEQMRLNNWVKIRLSYDNPSNKLVTILNLSKDKVVES